MLNWTYTETTVNVDIEGDPADSLGEQAIRVLAIGRILPGATRALPLSAHWQEGDSTHLDVWPGRSATGDLYSDRRYQ